MMSSVIEGYNYDIFISYRQKDNKYDGWVTEFVENLKRELEATFKEEVSVYFDINPHDGLLETHDVSDSLKEKLKCLVFVPIISRTYCDPKSFAWVNEFLAFIETSSKDRFGLKVKLPNGNITSRILPVRINDLDPEDIKLVESLLGFIRSVDFIYHSQGVNRPLRQRDDDLIQSAKQLIYRDQINKVANAISEIINSIKKAENFPSDDKELLRKEVIISGKHRKTKVASTAVHKAVKHTSFRLLRWPITIFILLLASWYGIRYYLNNEKMKWARQVQIPAIQKLIDDNFIPPTRSFDMAAELGRIIPGDSKLLKIWPRVSSSFDMDSRPSGAKVYWRDYNDSEGDWRYVGKTPIKNAKFPRNLIRIKIEKEGFHTINYAGPSLFRSLRSDISIIKLDSMSNLPENMVRVPGYKGLMYINGLDALEEKAIGEFLIDKFEVTNKDYKKFLDSGGYNDKRFWNYPIIKDGKEVQWENAMNIFIDKTGNKGPAGWEVGSYPEGEDNYPVTGISWYEASAYACFAGKMLPTVYHWGVAANTSRSSDIIPLSNFNGKSTVEVGIMQGMSSFGISDLAGNAREWCNNNNGTREESFILGGGWNDPTYAFNDSGTQPSLDRSLSNGVRCIKILTGDSTYINLIGPIKKDFRDYYKEKPVDDNTFNQFMKQYMYDKSPLNPVVSHIEDPGNWKVEKVSIEAGYNNEQLPFWVFLPKDSKPPYQSVIYFPGSNAIFTEIFKTSEITFLDFITRSGRAIVFPILKGTYERRDGLNSDYPKETVFYKDHVLSWRRDFGRIIDYLETRNDFISDKIAYFGVSWGGFMGGIMPAVEKRFKVVVLFVGGMEMPKTFPEVDQINFIPRITQPTLMLNGKYDMYFPYESSQKPMFNLLGTPEKDKKIFLYETGHIVPRTDMIRETLSWLDKYLGQVKK